VLLHHYDSSRAARCRLKTEGAAAGKQVQTRFASEVLSEPVEQGLAQTVRRRPQGQGIGETHDSAAPLASNDAHLVCLQAGKQRKVTMCRRLTCQPGIAKRGTRSV